MMDPLVYKLEDPKKNFANKVIFFYTIAGECNCNVNLQDLAESKFSLLHNCDREVWM